MRVASSLSPDRPRRWRGALSTLLALVLVQGMVGIPFSFAQENQPPAKAPAFVDGEALTPTIKPTAKVKRTQAAPTTTPEPTAPASDGVLVVYDNPSRMRSALSATDRAEATLQEHGVTPEEVVEASADSGAVVKVEAPAGTTDEQLAQELQGQPGIAYAQPNYLSYPTEDTAPVAPDFVPTADEALPTNDPLCTPTSQFYAFATESDKAWQRVRTEGAVTVAVLDTGCRLDHEDLQESVLLDLAMDAYTTKPLVEIDPAEQDRVGHGTAVTGLLGARANNGVGIAGLSYNASLLPIKVSDDSEKGVISDARVLWAMDYLENKMAAGQLTNLRVINMSFGRFETIDPRNPLLQKITKLRNTYGVLTVSSGGNSNWPRPPAGEEALPSWPADYEDVVSVTAVNPDKRNIAGYHYNAQKDISAYGSYLRTTWSRLDGVSSAHGYTSNFTGTSGASPLVAGIAALLWAAKPTLSVDEVIRTLQATADPIVDPDHAGGLPVTNSSAGIVNARKAVEAVLPTTSLDECELAPIEAQHFTGQALVPGVNLRLASTNKTLREGVDYTVAYANNTYAGTASVTITGAGAFTGQRTTTFRVVPTNANLVVLVRFQGDTTGDGATGLNAPKAAGDGIRTEWEYLTRQYNEYNPDAYVKLSFRSYMHTISNNTHDVLSGFPQTQEGGRVAYLTLPETREHYLAAGDYAFARDSLAAFNAAYADMDAALYDADDNGVVDNLTLVPTLASQPSADSVFWPHHSTFNPAGEGSLSVGTGAQQKAISSYNIIDTNTLQDFAVGVISHEYLHVLGAPDYYRAHGRTGTPVGVWDIMSIAQSPRSWPLAVTRRDQGWTSIPQKTDNGSYTLFAPGTGRDQSIMISTPASEEYFVVEYRQKSGDPNAMDSAIGGSGIIVYRVNPLYRAQGNSGAEGDYVYVFRPGETSLDAGAGDSTNAQIAATGARTSIGQADLDATAASGALVYSDGTNSGITISATAETSDSLTFDISFPESYEGLWEGVSGADGVSTFGSDVGSVQTVADASALYACMGQGGGPTKNYLVKRYDGTDWASLSALPMAGLQQGSIALMNGELYFCGVDYATGPFTLKLYRYQAADDSWSPVGSVASSANGAAMGVVGSTLCIVAGSSDPNVTQVYRFEGGRFETWGNPIPIRPEYLSAPTVMDLNGGVALALGDYGSRTSQVYIPSGFPVVTWAPVPDLQLEASMNIGYSSTLSVGDKTYLVAGTSGQVPRLYTMTRRWVGGTTYEHTLETVELSQFAGEPLVPGSVSLATHGSYLYLSVLHGSGASAAVKTYGARLAGDFAPTSWRQVGRTTFSPAGAVSSQVYGGRLVAGVVNTSAKKAAFRAHEVLAEPDIISVEVPTRIFFVLEADKRGGPDAQIISDRDIHLTNNSDKPVYTYISRLDVRGASLVNTEADLGGNKTLMLALRDEKPAGFDTPEDYFPAAAPGASAVDVRYYPFNRAGQGMIAARTEAGGSTSPDMALYGKALTGWLTDGEEFTITPTLTITTQAPSS